MSVVGILFSSGSVLLADQRDPWVSASLHQPGLVLGAELRSSCLNSRSFSNPAMPPATLLYTICGFLCCIAPENNLKEGLKGREFPSLNKIVKYMSLFRFRNESKVLHIQLKVVDHFSCM